MKSVAKSGSGVISYSGFKDLFLSQKDEDEHFKCFYIHVRYSSKTLNGNVSYLSYTELPSTSLSLCLSRSLFLSGHLTFVCMYTLYIELITHVVHVCTCAWQTLSRFKV